MTYGEARNPMNLQHQMNAMTEDLRRSLSQHLGRPLTLEETRTAIRLALAEAQVRRGNTDKAIRSLTPHLGLERAADFVGALRRKVAP